MKIEPFDNDSIKLVKTSYISKYFYVEIKVLMNRVST